MNKTLRYAAISGILAVVILLPFLFIELFRALNIIGGKTSVTTQIVLNVITLLLLIFFLYGFKIIADKTKNNLLKIAVYLFIIALIINHGYGGYNVLTKTEADLSSTTTSSFVYVVYGIMGVLFGIGLLKLKKQLGTIAKTAGILAIISGITYATLQILGGFLVIPTYILLIILLFRASKKAMNAKQPSKSLSIAKLSALHNPRLKERLTIAFVVIVILAFILNVFIAAGIFGLLLGLTQIVFSLAGLVLSIILVKQRKFGLGITSLILFSIVLLMFAVGILRAG